MDRQIVTLKKQAHIHVTVHQVV